MSALPLSILIVNHNGGDRLERCVGSIGKRIRCAHEVIVLDNASTDDSVKHLRRIHPGVRLIESPINHGFARGNNKAAKHAQGQYLLLLNHDTELLSDIQPALELMEQQPDLGVVGARMLDENRNYRPSAGFFPSPLRLILIRSMYRRSGPFGTGDFPKKPGSYAVDWVEGSFLLTRSTLWNGLDGLDAGYVMYVEDVDYCRRALDAGFRTAYCPGVSYFHAGGFEIRRMEWTVRGFRRFHELHSGAAVRFAAGATLDLGLLARAAVGGARYLILRDADAREKMAVCWRALGRRGGS